MAADRISDYFFIEVVREYPMLYDKGNKAYFDNHKKSRIWSEVANRCGMKDNTEARKKWNGFLKTFKRKITSGNEAGEGIGWPFFTSMAWMEQFTVEREKMGGNRPVVKGLFVRKGRKRRRQPLRPPKDVEELVSSFEELHLNLEEVVEEAEVELVLDLDESLTEDSLPAYDFDQEQKHDLAAVSDFATEIFAYYQAREPFFKVHDYMPRQRFISIEVRAKLVSWMVEVQETFKLNHETLYLSVKLLDMYLDRVIEVKRESLQLLGSTAFLIAAKFDEHTPPLIDDFVYLSADSFDREQLLAMERRMLECVGFNLGAPLSYRFLRRYARVYKANMETLTLGRYVLETSLMFLDFCRTSESLIAVACLLLALRVKRVGDWSAVLEKYSGYTLAEVEPLMWALNHLILQRPAKYSRLDSVFKKYSHRVFHQVALIPSLDQSTSVVSAADIERFRLGDEE